MTVIETIQRSTEFLKRKGLASARLDSELLIAHVLGLDRVGLYVNYDRPLSTAEVDACRKLVVQRGQKVPVAYLRGRKEFMGLEFRVTPDVLIPRPETETLVEQVAAWVSSRSCTVVDLGTGSGAVAISVAHRCPNARVLATEVSEAAAAVARQNAEKHGVSQRVEVLIGDLFVPLAERGMEGGVDVLASNPPYLGAGEYQALEQDVRYEPRIALLGGDDGLEFHRRIASGAGEFIRKGGLLALEIGYAQGEAVTGLLTRTGCFQQVKIVKDLGGYDRVVLADRA